MAKKQTRRSVSHRAEVYATIERVAEARGQSVSGYVEEVLRDRWQLDGVTMVDRSDVVPKPPKPIPADAVKVSPSRWRPASSRSEAP